MTDALPGPVLTGINLFCQDLPATVAFYRKLGLDIDDGKPWSGHHIEVPMANGVHLELDSIELTKAYDAGFVEPTAGGGSTNVLVFHLPTRDAVDLAWTELTAAGHAGRLAPIDAFWGARYAIVGDPDGNRVGLMSPIDPEREAEPPSLS
jgi:catechol 2,3-dioxygenase-like lactoylglutathione lyase family enzyme